MLLDMALDAGAHARGEPVGLRDVALLEPITLPPGQGRLTRPVLDRQGDWHLSSRGEGWQTCTRGHLREARAVTATEGWDALRRGAPVSGQQHYEALATRGIAYAKPLRSVRRLFSAPGQALAELDRVEERGVLLDAALQALVAAMPGGPGLWVVARLGSVELCGPAHGAVWAHAVLTHERAGHVTLMTADGEPLGALRDVHLASLPRALWEERWELTSDPGTRGPGDLACLWWPGDHGP